MEKTNTDIRILKTATCPSLSGRSELTYEFGYNEGAKALVYRLKEHTGPGHHNSSWIFMDSMLDILSKAKDPFSLSIFRPLYAGQSINNTGFLGALLCSANVNLVVCEKRRYKKKETKAFMADLNKLLKRTKKTAKKKSTKT